MTEINWEQPGDWGRAMDDEENQLYDRRVSPEGNLFMAIHPVIFGARIRAGRVGDPSCLLDWCCGDSKGIVSLTYHQLLHFLEAGGDMRDLPRMSEPKPWYRDSLFVLEVAKVYGQKLPISDKS